MNIIQMIILSIVEGITEFLPISSTGHMIIISKLLKIKETNFLTSFEISIQLGAIIAVIILYWKDLFLNLNIIKKLITAFIPTAIIGLCLYKFVKNVLLINSNIVSWSLLIGGFILIIFEKFANKNKQKYRTLEKIGYKQAALIGLFQSIAIIPGVSRSAATIIGGVLTGLNRKTAVEFSFLLAVPTMAAATALDMIKNASSLSIHEVFILIIGMIISFIVAIISIKFLLHFVKKHSFVIFGIYRIFVGILFLLIV